jgi:hypothetical protein
MKEDTKAAVWYPARCTSSATTGWDASSVRAFSWTACAAGYIPVIIETWDGSVSGTVA